MSILISTNLLKQIHNHGEITYPEEGAGLLLGPISGIEKTITDIIQLTNAREETARHNRYLISPEAMLKAERTAIRDGLEILGIFHSHPDHPNFPSDFDLQWALPWYTYIITSVHNGQASTSRAWRMRDNRSGFDEETIYQDITISA